jgi:hypothetical protein
MNQPFPIDRVLLSDVPNLGREIEIQEDLWMAFGQFKDDLGIELRELREGRLRRLDSQNDRAGLYQLVEATVDAGDVGVVGQNI